MPLLTLIVEITMVCAGARNEMLLDCSIGNSRVLKKLKNKHATQVILLNCSKDMLGIRIHNLFIVTKSDIAELR